MATILGRSAEKTPRMEQSLFVDADAREAPAGQKWPAFAGAKEIPKCALWEVRNVGSHTTEHPSDFLKDVLQSLKNLKKSDELDHEITRSLEEEATTGTDHSR